MEPTQQNLMSDDVRLNVLTLGAAQAPPLVMLHGLRDVAWGLLPIAVPLAHRFHILLPELRGHGASDHPGAYAMANFLYDLRQVLDQLTSVPAVLFGHSLGGQIVSRFAAIFPELTRAAIIVEGLGPPARPHEGDPVAEIAAYREQLLGRLGRGQHRRSLPSFEYAAERLLKNNPRMDPALAHTLARRAVREMSDGQLSWAFDSTASSVFVGTSREEGARFWRQVACPVLAISGALSHEYWGGEIKKVGISGQFADGEMERRVANFKDHEHVWFDGSGHMVHYDEPERLTRTVTGFLERRLAPLSLDGPQDNPEGGTGA